MAELPWKVRQYYYYYYFWIASEVLTADEITLALGIPPDRSDVMGSRRTSPRMVPPEHRWKIVCDTQGRIDEQVTTLLKRLDPIAAKVRALVDRGDVGAGLTMDNAQYAAGQRGRGASPSLIRPLRLAYAAGGRS